MFNISHWVNARQYHYTLTRMTRKQKTNNRTSHPCEDGKKVDYMYIAGRNIK
jgi:hypothetical protein